MTVWSDWVMVAVVTLLVWWTVNKGFDCFIDWLNRGTEFQK
jgi:hypothetical protein